MDVDWQTDLDRWLAPFVAALRDFVAWRLRSVHWRRRGLFTQHGSK
jgi:hypothetical protein